MNKTKKKLYSINQFGDFRNNPDLLLLDATYYVRNKYDQQDDFKSEIFVNNNLAIYVSDFDYILEGKITNEKHITSLVWRYNNNLYTKRGITIGSSEGDIQEAYGDGFLINYRFNGEKAHVIYYGEKEDTACSDCAAGIEFMAQNDKVVQISIYKEPRNVDRLGFNDDDYWIEP